MNNIKKISCRKDKCLGRRGREVSINALLWLIYTQTEKLNHQMVKRWDAWLQQKANNTFCSVDKLLKERNTAWMIVSITMTLKSLMLKLPLATYAEQPQRRTLSCASGDSHTGMKSQTRHELIIQRRTPAATNANVFLVFTTHTIHKYMATHTNS